MSTCTSSAHTRLSVDAKDWDRVAAPKEACLLPVQPTEL